MFRSQKITKREYERERRFRQRLANCPVPARQPDNETLGNSPADVGEAEGIEGATSGDCRDFDDVAAAASDVAAGQIGDAEPPVAAEEPDHGYTDADMWQLDDDSVVEAFEESDDEPEKKKTKRRDNLSNASRSLSHFMCNIQARREVPKQVMTDIVAYMLREKDTVTAALQSEELTSFSHMQKVCCRDVPANYVTVSLTNPRNEEELWERLPRYPKKKINDGGYVVNYVLYHRDINELVDFHNANHAPGTFANVVDMSLDGVPQSKSGGISMEVLSVRFNNCRTVHTVAILRPMRKKMGLSDDIILKPLLEGERQGIVRIRRVVADAPKRASLQGMKQHSARYACPYCKARKKGKCYPSTTMYDELRTDAELRRLAEEAADRPPRTEGEEAYYAGVKGLSPLRNVKDLDLIRDVPAEMMHLVCLGVVKKIMALSFRGGGFRQSDVDCRQVTDDRLNEILLASKSLTRFSRRTRPMDIANYKAEEYRNLAYVFWPAAMLGLPREVVDIWLLTVYVFRAASLNEEIYAELDKEHLQNLLRRWYRSFEEAFGERNCSYNIHVFHHLLSVRELGPLPETSAVCYESHYNLLKRSYQAGTESIGLQAMANLAVAFKYGHLCASERQLRMRNTKKTDDRHVYLRSRQIIQLSKLGEDTVTGREVAVDPAYVPINGVNMNDVLAFRLSSGGGLGKELTVPLQDVLGQAVICDKYISVVTWNMLEG